MHVFIHPGEKASKSNKNSNPGNDGGGSQGEGNDGPPIQALVMFSAGLYIAYMTISTKETQPGREISWQEFSGQLLESGQVDRILISNKKTAR